MDVVRDFEMFTSTSSVSSPPRLGCFLSPPPVALGLFICAPADAAFGSSLSLTCVKYDDALSELLSLSCALLLDMLLTLGSKRRRLRRRARSRPNEDGGEGSGIMTSNDNNGGNADGCRCCQRNETGSERPREVWRGPERPREGERG